MLLRAGRRRVASLLAGRSAGGVADGRASASGLLLLLAGPAGPPAPLAPAWGALGMAGASASRGFAFGRGKDDVGGGDASPSTTAADADLLSSSASASSAATDAATSSTSDTVAAALAAFDPNLAIAASSAAEAAALAAAREGVWVFNSGFQSALVAVQEATGAPWWGAIVAATIIARTLMLPVVARQMRNTRKLAAARPEMLALQEWFKEQQLLLGGGGGMADTAKNPASKALVEQYQARLAGVWAKHDCHPVKSLGPLFLQAPLFIGFFSALRSLAAAGVPSLTHGGAAWFPNLAAADPTYGLPLASAALFLATVEAGAADGMQGQDPATLKRMKFLMRGLAVGLVPLTASMPAGVFVYWATSNAYSLAQALALKTAPVRRLMGVPEPSKEAGVAAATPAAVTPGGVRAPAPSLPAAGKPVATFDRPPTGKRRRPGRQ